MNTATALAAAALVGGVAATGTVLVLAPRPLPEVEASDATVAALRTLEARLASMEASLDENEERYARLESTVEARLAAATRQPLVAAAVGAPAAPAEPLAAAADADAPSDREAALDDLMAQLLAADFDDLEEAELWRRAIDEGLIDDLVARFEERAAADPDNPDAHVELGGAYIQKIQEVGSSPLAGMWATKADQAFDRALALDENHWGARMSKAVSLSFWPPIFGKQAEAVNQFQTLIEKQRDMPLDGRHESPYLLLGNLHWQRGDTEEALAVWQEGASLFPNSTDLASALANAGD